MDFDHTIVDLNTDVEVQDLAKNGNIPRDIQDLYTNKCWTDFMQAVFVLLHQQVIIIRLVICMKIKLLGHINK
jgi:hypothetical protein